MDEWASPVLAAKARYLRYLANTDVSETIQRPGLYAVQTGVFSNAENGVVAAGDSLVTTGLVHELSGWFAELGMPASWLCADGVQAGRTATVLEACGWEPERTAWGMRAELGSLSGCLRSDRAAVVVELVGSTRDVHRWLEIAGACGWFTTDAQRAGWERLLRGTRRGASELKLYLARTATRHVGIASAFYADQFVLLTALAVVKDARRRGIGRSLAVARLREARARGCARAVLEPTPDGAAFYKRLGFLAYREPADRCFRYQPPDA